MESPSVVFDARKTLEKLRHYLPAQAALKDFVHHNTLHAFQHDKFHTGLSRAALQFGYSTYLSLEEYRTFFREGKISEDVLDKVLRDRDPDPLRQTQIKSDLFSYNESYPLSSRVGRLRSGWQVEFGVAMDKAVQPLLFRVLAAFLDQGISSWKFPYAGDSFLEAIRGLEASSRESFFKTDRARDMLFSKNLSIKDLLDILVGAEDLFEHYLLDQQFSHPGWSGFVAVVEQQPSTLLDRRDISLHDLILFELLLEIDVLDYKFGISWKPLAAKMKVRPASVFRNEPEPYVFSLLALWQEALEWSFFDDVLYGVSVSQETNASSVPAFQALFCIDDREYSLRRHVERIDPRAQTFGTPGFFGVEFYFRPENGKFTTKACPAPIDPKFLIKEESRSLRNGNEIHFSENTQSLLAGWFLSLTMGFVSMFRLLKGLFRPDHGPASVYSFSHMDGHSRLVIESTGEQEEGLQVGFTDDQMVARVEQTLKSIGLSNQFSGIIYVIGHGASSINNPYYAGYDCGACCGRPGAVNARVFAYMANKRSVRALLAEKGLIIPDSTCFVGAMHDTTRDEIEFYDVPIEAMEEHRKIALIFKRALEANANERNARFTNGSNSKDPISIHRAIKQRSVSFFEPRPEWNHATNALCIIGGTHLYKDLYLGKRPFINSYDHRQDPQGKYLLAILSAAIPVCGGINLEYFFSRTDQQLLGAGTKLPHNVVGLFAVNNGVDGDLRPGLPAQMIEIHDPLRILFIIEQKPQIVLEVISAHPLLKEWVFNEWVLMSVKDPESNEIFRMKDGRLSEYVPLTGKLKAISDEAELRDYYSASEVVSLKYRS